jgi:anti-sigma B factor antagonist
MKIATEIINDIKVLEISGSFDIYSATPVRYWLDETLNTAPAQVVIDLSDVGFIDSTALAILMQSIKRARENGGDIFLCGLQQPVRMVLELTRLDNVFEIFPEKEKAILGFNR